MSNMDKFQEDAEQIESTLNISGRFSFQENAMKLVANDIAKKLQIKPTDSLLDIGCNCGDITIPLSFVCRQVTGVDGIKTIERLNKRVEYISNITTLSGNFMDLNIEDQYDCILIYSVLMYIEPYNEKLRFVLKAAKCLKPGGRLLVGDIVNSSRKERFQKSSCGKKVDYEYRKNMERLTQEDKAAHKEADKMNDLCILNDSSLMQLLTEIRNAGYESYLLPQRCDLPFGYTRDDILVCAWD